MTALTFEVPWSGLCSDNRKFVSGQFILTKEYRESKALIGALSLAAVRKQKWSRQEGPLALEVVVREPDRRRRDLNWSKNCKDGITAGEGVWWDDSQVRWELWRFVEPCDKATAGAVVTIRVLDGFADCPNIGTHDAPMGRPGELQRPPAKRLQRKGRVRGGTATAIEPVSPASGRARGGRKPTRAPRERGESGVVAGRKGAAKAQARAVRSQATATATPHHFELEGAR
jgi:Holliday junction resolvase RusA-like endonuclease